MKSGDEIADDEIADRLSNLPEDLLREILSHLSLKECVASSILSTTWSTLWTELPSLDLDERCFEGYEFRNIIWKLLKTRSEEHPVLRLRLSWIQNGIPTWDVVGWIGCFVGKEIKEIDLALETTFQRRYRLPNSLFSCGTENLVCLKLKGFIVLDTTMNLSAFPSVKVLELINVLYTEYYSLSKILSSCTVIEDLKLQIGVQPVKRLGVIFSVSTLKSFQCRLLSGRPPCEFKIDTPVIKFCNFRAQDCQIQVDEYKDFAEFDILEEETSTDEDY